MDSARRPGPLAGLKIIEMAGLGPVPLAGLILAGMGATVLRLARPNAGRDFLALKPEHDFTRHGRGLVSIDLKRPEGTALVLKLAQAADVLLEGFRPGVMERLGLGPDQVLAANPKLVYGRMTGFGQDGPLAERAGHDLTYLAYSGALHAIGEKGGKPVPPLNLVADYGGGTMFLVSGILAALFECSRSGKGQVVDAAMIDGVSTLLAPTYAYMASGYWQDRRGENLLDSGAPFYATYGTADGGHVAVACLEPQFFAEFAQLLPLPAHLAARQYDPSLWAEMREAITRRLAQRTRDEWAALFEPTDACVAPVLSLEEAPDHPHNRARKTHARLGRFVQPAPAPRFSRTPGEATGPLPAAPAAALAEFGISAGEAETLVSAGILRA